MKIQFFSAICFIALFATVAEAGLGKVFIPIYELVDHYAMLLTRPMINAIFIKGTMQYVCGTGLSKLEPYIPSGLGLTLTAGGDASTRCTEAIEDFFNLYFSTGADYEAAYNKFFARKNSIPID